MTNIARLADAILPEDRRTKPPTMQLKLYLPGLGTGEELFVGAVKVGSVKIVSLFVQADAFAICRVLTATDCSRKYDSRTIFSHRIGCPGTRFVRFRVPKFAWVGETDCKSAATDLFVRVFAWRIHSPAAVLSAGGDWDPLAKAGPPPLSEGDECPLQSARRVVGASKEKCARTKPVVGDNQRLSDGIERLSCRRDVSI